MSGLLHPQGPEPARTYWIRRGILLAVVLVLIIMIVIGVKNLTRSVVAAAPAPTITPPAVAHTPSSTPSLAVSASPTLSASTPTPGATRATSTPKQSASATANATARASAAAEASTAAKAGAAAKASAKASQSAGATQDCSPEDLRITLDGESVVSPGQKTTFKLSAINTSKVTCIASVTDKSFELKITVGKDRVWSSKDCSTVLTGFKKQLTAGAAADWQLAWNGKRSVEGKKCKVGKPPRSGAYWAVASLKGAKSARLPMLIG